MSFRLCDPPLSPFPLFYSLILNLPHAPFPLTLLSFSSSLSLNSFTISSFPLPTPLHSNVLSFFSYFVSLFFIFYPSSLFIILLYLLPFSLSRTSPLLPYSPLLFLLLSPSTSPFLAYSRYSISFMRQMKMIFPATF